MMELLEDVVRDTLMMLPFLYFTYLLMEYIEHKSSVRMKRILIKSRKLGPLLGSVLGIVPQCGFSVLASGLYVNKTITLGTLISVFVATSDEAIPILIAQPAQGETLLKIIGVKLIVASLAGFSIDFLLRNRRTDISMPIHGVHEHCEEETEKHSSLFSLAFFHAIKVFFFIFVVNFLLSFLIHLNGEETISKLLASDTMLQPLIAAIVGFIPNCAASVVLSQLYLDQILTFGSLTAGLITSAGLGLLALFRMYDNKKDLLRILLLLFAIGVFTGMILELI